MKKSITNSKQLNIYDLETDSGNESETIETTKEFSEELSEELPVSAFTKFRNQPTFAAIIVTLGGVLGLISAWFLALDDRELLLNPDDKLSCDFSAIISCSEVAQTWQATLLNFFGMAVPNAYLGLIAQSVFITVGVALIFNSKFPKWFLYAALGGALFAAFFSYWLFYQELFDIGALCPWCMNLLVAETLLFLGLWHYLSVTDGLPLPQKYREKFIAWSYSDYGFYLTILWFLILVIIIISVFGTTLF